MGIAKLATTPEAVIENQPFRHRASSCVIVADARIDNRDELSEWLAPDRPPLGDAELILLAYLRWGTDCPIHLLGDFAFAIWDERNRQLFAARDPMGMRQFCFSLRPGKLLAFATDAEAVAAHREIPAMLNEARIADLLADLESTDPKATFYRNVVRLEAGHCLALDQIGLSSCRYFKPVLKPLLKLNSDEEYAEALVDVLRPAIRARLRSAGAVGLMLSGGLDSSTIAALGCAMKSSDGAALKSFTVIDEGSPNCVESRMGIMASRLPGLDPRLIGIGDVARDPEFVNLIRTIRDPFDFAMSVPRAVYLAAHRAGCNVVLDGRVADTVFDGSNHLACLLRTGAYREALSEAKGEMQFWSEEKVSLQGRLARAAVRGIVPRWMRMARRHLGWALSDRFGAAHGLASERLERRAPIASRRALHRSRTMAFSRIDRVGRAASIHHDYIYRAAERYDRVAASVGIEARDPFADLRVIGFALSLPTAQLQKRGWPKYILRNAMRGQLPDDIRWRHGKPHLGWKLTVQTMRANLVECGMTEQTFQYVNESSARKIVAQWLRGGDCEEIAILLSLNLWLGALGAAVDEV